MPRRKKKKKHRRKKRNKSHIRDKWEQYGITKQRYSELKAYCQCPENAPAVAQEAERACKMISAHIFASVTKNRSYEGVEYLNGQRISCGRTDFYGFRRMTYAAIDKRLREEERKKHEGEIEGRTEQEKNDTTADGRPFRDKS